MIAALDVVFRDPLTAEQSTQAIVVINISVLHEMCWNEQRPNLTLV